MSPAILYLRLEEGPTPLFDPKDCVWENKTLLKLFEADIIANRLRESWVYDEIKAGYSMEKIVDEFWKHEYEDWALKYLQEMRIETYEGCED